MTLITQAKTLKRADALTEGDIFTGPDGREWVVSYTRRNDNPVLGHMLEVKVILNDGGYTPVWFTLLPNTRVWVG